MLWSTQKQASPPSHESSVPNLAIFLLTFSILSNIFVLLTKSKWRIGFREVYKKLTKSKRIYKNLPDQLLNCQ